MIMVQTIGLLSDINIFSNDIQFVYGKHNTSGEYTNTIVTFSKAFTTQIFGIFLSSLLGITTDWTNSNPVLFKHLHCSSMVVEQNLTSFNIGTQYRKFWLAFGY